jgi:hypothetical protein
VIALLSINDSPGYAPRRRPRSILIPAGNVAWPTGRTIPHHKLLVPKSFIPRWFFGSRSLNLWPTTDFDTGISTGTTIGKFREILSVHNP